GGDPSGAWGRDELEAVRDDGGIGETEEDDHVVRVRFNNFSSVIGRGGEVEVADVESRRGPRAVVMETESELDPLAEHTRQIHRLAGPHTRRGGGQRRTGSE